MAKQTSSAPAKGATQGNGSAKPAAKAKLKPSMIEAIFVRTISPTGTFRRSGITFTRQGVTVALADLTAAQLEAIKAEPMLIVAETEVQAPDSAGAPSQGAADDGEDGSPPMPSAFGDPAPETQTEGNA